MDTSNNKTSYLVASQVPEFVRRDHPMFVSFLEEYYKWMEQDGNVLYTAKKFPEFLDLDKYKEDTIEDYIEYGGIPPEEMYHRFFDANYFGEYTKFIPQDSVSDLSLIVTHSLDILRARGTAKSYRFLSNAFYGKDADIYYPQENILKASDGKWFIEKSINIRDVKVDYSDNPRQINGFAQTVNFITNTVTAGESYFDIEVNVGDVINFSGNTVDYTIINVIDRNRIVLNAHPPHVYGNAMYVKVEANTTAFQRFVNTTINGLTSNAFATVESANPYYDSGTLITELKVSNVTRDFINGEELVATIEDEGRYKTLKANLFSGIVSHVTVTSPGSGYIEGASVPVIPVPTEIGVPANGSGAQVIISKVSKRRLEGKIKAVDLVYNSGTTENGTDYGYYMSGAGYLADDPLLFTGGGGKDAAANVLTVLDDGTYHDPYISIIGSKISDVGDYALTNNSIEILTVSDIANLMATVANTSEKFSFTPLANVYTNTSNLKISSEAGDIIQDVTLNQWTGNSNVYFETGDVLFFYNYPANIGYQEVVQTNKYDNYITIVPGIPGNMANLRFEVIKKANANTTIANSMIYWTYGPCGPIVSTAIINAGSGYIELPTVSVQSNTMIRSLGILGRVEIIEPGSNYAVGDRIVFDNPVGTYGIAANAQISEVDSNGSILQINFMAEPGLPPGGFGYNALNLPTANIRSANGVGANLAVVATLADDAQLVARSNVIGSIDTLKIVSGGTGYEAAPLIDLSTQGDGTAQAYSNIVTGVYSYPGRYLDQSGQLSSYTFLENRDYYQKYSYVIKIAESISRYRNPFNVLLHPAGTKMFGQYMFADNNESAKPTANIVAQYNFAGNTTNLIIDLDAFDYLDSVTNQGTPLLWYNSANLNQYANIANAPYFINGGLSVDGDPTGNIIFDYTSQPAISDLQNVCGPYYYGGGIFFDGNNDMVLMNHNDSLNVSNNLTLTTWFTVANTDEDSVKTLVYKMNGTNNGGYHLYVNQNTLEFDMNPSTGNNNIVLTDNVTNDVWSMVTVTYDGTTIRGYLNGVLVNTSIGNSTARSDTKTPLWIGSANTNNVHYGKIGSVQIYDRAIGNNEVSNNFNQNRGKFGL
jgi:Concanavalin A-like lectin/glucanases superfamily